MYSVMKASSSAFAVPSGLPKLFLSWASAFRGAAALYRAAIEELVRQMDARLIDGLKEKGLEEGLRSRPA